MCLWMDFYAKNNKVGLFVAILNFTTSSKCIIILEDMIKPNGYSYLQQNRICIHVRIGLCTHLWYCDDFQQNHDFVGAILISKRYALRAPIAHHSD